MGSAQLVKGSGLLRVGWRWESIDTVKTPGEPAFMTCGDHTTLGPAMTTFPQPGQYSVRAGCRVAELHPDKASPVEGCSCGYRMVATVDLALHYMFRVETLRHQTNLAGLVLVRVEADGPVVADSFSPPLNSWQCVNARQVRPVWPAFVTDPAARQLLSMNYHTSEIYLLEKWRQAPAAWMQIKETRHVSSAVR
jgi:hypothetical protein